MSISAYNWQQILLISGDDFRRKVRNYRRKSCELSLKYSPYYNWLIFEVNQLFAPVIFPKSFGLHSIKEAQKGGKDEGFYISWHNGSIYGVAPASQQSIERHR
jgi:hypothetical protein